MLATKVYEPVIKWSGSKRSVALLIATLLPAGHTYFEPFVGGGAVLPFRTCKTGIAGDIIPELINIWICIRDFPELTAKEYEDRWQRLQREGHTAYYHIRESFNKSRDAHDLLFLTRTCVNGLIRFNSDRNFNNSLHHTRPGISPHRLRTIIHQWSDAIRDVEFIAGDYRQTLATAKEGDIVFLDPPYGGTKGRYVPGDFDLDPFYAELQRLNQIGAQWILTFDGSAGEREYAATPPSSLYRVRLELPTGKSPFTRLMATGLDTVVESVYLNFEPPSQI
jgi:DNA adenine methylase